MGKNLIRYLTVIVCSLLMFSCAPSDKPTDTTGPTDNEGGGADPNTTNEATLFYSFTGNAGCGFYFNLGPQYIEKMEITVFYVETDQSGGTTEAKPTKWGKRRVLRDADLGIFEPQPTFQVPSDGKFFVSVRVILKCVPCCPDCSQQNPQNNWEGRGKPLFTGNTRNLDGGVTEVEVDLVWDYCDDCQCSEPEEYI